MGLLGLLLGLLLLFSLRSFFPLLLLAFLAFRLLLSLRLGRSCCGCFGGFLLTLCTAGLSSAATYSTELIQSSLQGYLFLQRRGLRFFRGFGLGLRFGFGFALLARVFGHR